MGGDAKDKTRCKLDVDKEVYINPGDPASQTSFNIYKRIVTQEHRGKNSSQIYREVYAIGNLQCTYPVVGSAEGATCSFGLNQGPAQTH